MKLSRRGIVVILVVLVVAIIGFLFIFQKTAKQRPWTAAAVIKYLKGKGLSVESATTNDDMLPKNLPKPGSLTCREHVLFTIAIHTLTPPDEYIPNNQLFVCDTSYNASSVLLAYAGLANQYTVIANNQANVILILSSDVALTTTDLYRITLATIGMQYVGPSD